MIKVRNIAVLLLFSCYIAVMIVGCKKDPSSDNKYKDWKGKEKPAPLPDPAIDVNSIQGLHYYIFKPTCSNSGCHDGTFEPDFRTTESSYTSLVNVPVIKSDASTPGQFLLRVVPGNADSSMLIRRCRVDLGGNSGIMPLSIDPSNNWPSKKDEYISRIEKWINDGAKDQFGNGVPTKDLAPQMGGMVVKSGMTTFTRSSNYAQVDLPVGTANITVYFSFVDDNTPQDQFTSTTVDTTSNPLRYTGVGKVALTKLGTALSMPALFNNTRDYWYSVNLNVADKKAGQVVWFKTTVSDNVTGITEVPSINANFNNMRYFSIKFN